MTNDPMPILIEPVERQAKWNQKLPGRSANNWDPMVDAGLNFTVISSGYLPRTGPSPNHEPRL